MGRYREASKDIELSVRFAGDTAHIPDYISAQMLLGEQLTELAEYERAEEVLLDCLAAIERWPLSVKHVEINGNFNDLYRDWGSSHSRVLALKHGNAALTNARRLANPRFLPEGLFYAAIGEAKFGNASRALELSLELESLAKNLKEPRQVYRAAWSRGTALEALNRPEEALTAYKHAYGVSTEAGAMLHQHKLGLKVARLTRDLESAHEHLAWFEERDLINGANLVRRHFPELGGSGQKSRTLSPLQAEGTSKPGNPGRSSVTASSDSRLEVLGPMQLHSEGRLEAVRGQKRKELLALLLQARIAGRSEVSSLELIETLYPGTPDQEALYALKQMVSKVRSGFGQGVINTTSNSYALGSLESDAEQFLVAPNAALWRGKYLEDLSLQTDGLVEHALYQALTNFAKTLIETDSKEASRLGRVLLETDPYDLEALRLTLQALRQSKNHRSLVRIYQEARAQLTEVGERLPADWSDFLAQVVA